MEDTFITPQKKCCNPNCNSYKLQLLFIDREGKDIVIQLVCSNCSIVQDIRLENDLVINIEPKASKKIK